MKDRINKPDNEFFVKSICNLEERIEGYKPVEGELCCPECASQRINLHEWFLAVSPIREENQEDAEQWGSAQEYYTNFPLLNVSPSIIHDDKKRDELLVCQDCGQAWLAHNSVFRCLTDHTVAREYKGDDNG